MHRSKEFKHGILRVNGLFSDPGKGKGCSIDFSGTLFKKGFKIEWANFKADPGTVLYKGWVKNCLLMEGELINCEKINLKTRYGNIPLGFLPYATSTSFNPNQDFEEREIYFTHNTVGLDVQLTCNPFSKITTELRSVLLKEAAKSQEVDIPSSTTQWIFNMWVSFLENGMLSFKFHTYSENKIGRCNLHKIGIKFGF